MEELDLETTWVGVSDSGSCLAIGSFYGYRLGSARKTSCEQKCMSPSAKSVTLSGASTVSGIPNLHRGEPMLQNTSGVSG